MYHDMTLYCVLFSRVMDVGLFTLFATKTENVV